MFQILETISDPGHPEKPNEDACGHTDAHAWVIDGATGVADGELLAGDTDARWLAQSASGLFAEQAVHFGDDLAGLTRFAIETMREEFNKQKLREPNGRYELPSAAMSLMHCDGHQIHCANFADCRLVLLGDDGDMDVLGDHHIDREAASKSRTAKLLEAVGDDGYWILGLDPRAVDFMRTWAIPLTQPVTGLLMSDGFASLAYDYKRLDLAELIVQAREEGLESIVDMIRQVERNDDPAKKFYPRFKGSDDATAILFRAAPDAR
jgi:serine/threonine protein phosphatase PrpC